MILIASTQYIKKSLFDLQYESDESHNKMENVTDLRGAMLMMNELHDDHNLTVNSIDAIEKVRQLRSTDCNCYGKLMIHIIIYYILNATYGCVFYYYLYESRDLLKHTRIITINKTVFLLR